MDTVLAAFDLSPMGRRVADRAREIAEAHGASLHLVHIGEIPDVELPEEMLERIRLYRHSKAENLLAWINSRARCDVTLMVRRGNVAVELAKMSKKADLLVTGLHRSTPSESAPERPDWPGRPTRPCWQSVVNPVLPIGTRSPP